MAYSLRYRVCHKMKSALEGLGLKNLSLAEVSQKMSLKLNNGEPEYHVLTKVLPVDIDSSEFLKNIEFDDVLLGAYVNKQSISLRLSRNSVVTNVLQEGLRCQNPAEHSANFHSHVPSTILTEFSSPNIAKPFHMGHLRSTIIGAFISNLYEFLGNRVVRINYLGDWGTQFGYLKVGFDKTGLTLDNLGENAIDTLYNIYVKTTKESKSDETVIEMAKRVFSQMEKEDAESLKVWQRFREVSIENFTKSYNRLGVAFDHFHGESMYTAKDMETICEELSEKGLVETLDDGRRVVKLINNNQNCTIMKSDGTPLYLTRDIAAAIYRYNEYAFNKMFYVVDNAQTSHFSSLFEILSRLGYDWVSLCQHVKFGRYSKMSTREGNVVFLNDVLEGAKSRALQQLKKDSRLCEEDLEVVADVLGVSAVIINDLKHRRMGDAEFNWDRMLQVTGNTGIQLQYGHCRLVSLEEKCGIPIDLQAVSYLEEKEALELAVVIARFEEVVSLCERELEACIMVNYLFTLHKAVSRAMRVLKVKDEASDVAAPRLLLFHTARRVLATGIKILGLTPLNQI